VLEILFCSQFIIFPTQLKKYYVLSKLHTKLNIVLVTFLFLCYSNQCSEDFYCILDSVADSDPVDQQLFVVVDPESYYFIKFFQEIGSAN
jgi:hypothetical protein